MSKGEGLAPDGRSVSPQAAGREGVAERPIFSAVTYWAMAASTERMHMESCVRQARQTNHNLLTHKRIARKPNVTMRKEFGDQLCAYLRGQREAFMVRAHYHRSAKQSHAEKCDELKRAACSEAEATQREGEQ